MSDETTRVRIAVLDDQLLVNVGEELLALPIGPRLLALDLCSDPPAPEELTNAVGLVFDHFDDVVRLAPHVLDSTDVSLMGRLAQVIAAVEVGAATELPYTLDRSAAEEVFRTMATESRRDRAANPGLPADELDSIVAWCCVVVGVMRRLHLDAIQLVAA